MEDNIIMLEDDQGNQIECETIDVFEFNNETYFALLEIVDEGEENDEIILMKVQTGETDEDMSLVTVDDEAELEAAFQEFLRRDQEASEE